MKKFLPLLIVMIGLTSCKENTKKQTASDETLNSIDNSVELTEEQKDLKKNAIPIQNLSKLSDKIYDEIANYEIIMIGEMHGTNEPAEFAYGLCELIAKHEGSVIMAMEIRASLMNNLSDEMSISELKELDFFRGKNFDGRNGIAWLDLVYKGIKNDGIILKFIDNPYPSSTRDSSMYREIRNIHNKHPNTKIVTLTGNTHNSFIPLFNKERIGGYLLKDTVNFDSKKIMSINHVFSEGNMLNNDLTGLKMRTIEREENIYNTTLSYEIFLYKKLLEEQNRCTHILYTDKVTASEIIKKDDK
ncbi:hypothetical protein ESY86_20605 [Subsaximicrobium wynnwilliamsii]|uniref:ChaN family lipoprotein n=1 Tax=Subsaximicrobium wynnwilliamsii TaxID=291179 RepID=A0A5C6Z9P8_9FLAO|nr:hypothetical protein [Subsaximicrobium wynnwilliamsii]TXD80654.1 hypothetical protein ESY87_20450 [Subsaximicrobium wynnwilliamsii]TXD86101.1 hypothetical protein ESY86_20605 [Subsaximicrobium wynnwilliamsii]TXD99840.1 hypothetical protein ESY88_20390 [Subsaximicrobium wynnwilliamsii]